MKIRFYILIIFLFLSNNLIFAINDTLDLIFIQEINDSIKIEKSLFYCQKIMGSQPYEVIYYGNKTLSLSERINFIKGKIESNNLLGTVYRQLGNYTMALEYYFKSLKLCTDISDKTHLAKTYTNLGYVYQKLKDFNVALDYQKKALEIFAMADNKKDIATCFNSIAVTYEKQGKSTEAFEYHLKALKFWELLNDKEGLAKSYNNFSVLYRMQRNFSLALDYQQKALKIREELQDKFGITISYINFGQMYEIQKEYKKAIENYKKALNVARSINNKEGIKLAYENLFTAYFAINQKDNAYESFIKYSQVKDSLFVEEKAKEIGRLEANFEIERRLSEEKRLSEITAEKEKQEFSRKRNLQYLIIFVAVILVFVILFMLGKFEVPTQLIGGLLFMAFLLLFEFILVLVEPFTSEYTGGVPIPTLIINGILALIFAPLHKYLERKLMRRLLK